MESSSRLRRAQPRAQPESAMTGWPLGSSRIGNEFITELGEPLHRELVVEPNKELGKRAKPETHHRLDREWSRGRDDEIVKSSSKGSAKSFFETLRRSANAGCRRTASRGLPSAQPRAWQAGVAKNLSAKKRPGARRSSFTRPATELARSSVMLGTTLRASSADA